MNRLMQCFDLAYQTNVHVCLALVLLLSSDVRGDLVFNQAQTGAQLAANPNVTFPTDQPTANGDSLDFINTADSQVLLRWSLLPAAPRAPLEITVTVNYDPITTFTPDNDPIFGITAGSRFLGLGRFDNNSGSASAIAGSVTTTQASLGVGDTIVPSGLGVVDPFTFDLSSELLAVTRHEEGAISTTGTFTRFNAMFDPTEPIAFILASGGVTQNEGYRINSLAVSITAIPEPSSLAFAGTVALVMLIGHLSKKAKQSRRTSDIGCTKIGRTRQEDASFISGTARVRR